MPDASAARAAGRDAVTRRMRPLTTCTPPKYAPTAPVRCIATRPGQPPAIQDATAADVPRLAATFLRSPGGRDPGTSFCVVYPDGAQMTLLAVAGAPHVHATSPPPAFGPPLPPGRPPPPVEGFRCTLTVPGAAPDEAFCATVEAAFARLAETTAEGAELLIETHGRFLRLARANGVWATVAQGPA